jgi:hypothetical protein
MFFAFALGLMTRRRALAVLLLATLCISACVTRTERVGYYPHTRSEDEGVWDELRREFGWQKKPQTGSGEPFYTRATRGVKATVSGWFHKEDDTRSDAQKDAQKLEESHRQFEQERQEAFRRLREQQEQQN